MYTRNYDTKDGILIPESYGGTALNERGALSEECLAGAKREGKNPWEGEESKDAQECGCSHKNCNPENNQSTPFLSFLPNIFKNGSFGLQNIGKEEILIIAASIFLFLSKEGDKECAVMLLLLLFLS